MPFHHNRSRLLSGRSEAGTSEEEFEPGHAVLFPFFVVAIGVAMSYFLTRFAPMFPQSGAMFVVGVLIGIEAELGDGAGVLNDSVSIWIAINPELLLLSFLPALLFGDALQVNWQLFKKSFPQTMLLAFPGVLLGTVLTATVVFYAFPNDFSFNLAMVLGAILSATDPVSVTSTLNEVGAPPRLRMLIQGESMLNDGSAIVFFSIFTQLFLAEQGVGQDVDVAEGFSLFFQKAVGGALIGVAFAIMLVLLLWMLDRELDEEETVLQVGATVAFAYLSYFTAEVSAETSGVLAVVFCGVITSAYGLTMIHDRNILWHVWGTIEFLGNTLLFTLGGAVWGSIVTSNADFLVPQDWGFMIVLYLILFLIRIIVIGVFFPVISRVGLRASWQDSVMMVWGGLRGAVGIALALSLDNSVTENVSATTIRDQSATIFAYVGAMALLTLLINAPTVEPLLEKLGLIRSSQARLQLVQAWHHALKLYVLDVYTETVNQERFSCCDRDIVRYHVPILYEATDVELEAAERKYRLKKLIQPDLMSHAQVKRTLERHGVSISRNDSHDESSPMRLAGRRGLPKHARSGFRRILRRASKRSSQELQDAAAVHQVRLMELREVFLHLVQNSYWEMISHGELARQDFVDHILLQSVEEAHSAVAQGKPIDDWKTITTHSRNAELFVKAFFGSIAHMHKRISVEHAREHDKQQWTILSYAILHAHRSAQMKFCEGFVEDDSDLLAAEKQVFEESDAVIAKAQAFVDSIDRKLRVAWVSHLVAVVVLHAQVEKLREARDRNVLQNREVESFRAAAMKALTHVRYCTSISHSDSEEKNNANEKNSDNEEELELA